MDYTFGSLLVTASKQRNSDEALTGKWFGLLDVSPHKSVEDAKAQVSKLLNSQGEPINLYDDLDGTGLVEMGPLLYELTGQPFQQPSATIKDDVLKGISLLLSTATHTELVSHLRSLREVTLPDGSSALFRFHDTRVMEGLAPVLEDKQRPNILGPVAAWACMNACNELTLLQTSAKQKSTTAKDLRFTKAQIKALDTAQAPHELVAQVIEADSSVVKDLSACARIKKARQYIELAKQQSLTRATDVSLFGVLAFQLPAGFEAKPPFATAIKQAAQGSKTFSDGLDEATPEDWKPWNEWLAKEDGIKP